MNNTSTGNLVQDLMSQVHSLKKENKELHDRVAHLEFELNAKDGEKNMALKKQQAYVKELKKMAQEEKKRADNLERQGERSSSPSIVIGGDASSYRSRSMTDGQESVSSMSVLESDNIELINRFAELQRNHGEALHKISLLESSNISLSRENEEKTEVIEEWIRSRPLPNPSSSHSNNTTPPRGLAGFRKLIGMSDNGHAQSDVMEMNKKLQRLLEETLSKNLLLQRDLHTLLERTES